MAGAGTVGAAQQPGTIREMLLWLHGLGQKEQNEHKKKLEEYIGTTLTQKLQQSNQNASTSITRVTEEAKTLIGDVCTDAGHIIVCIQKGEKCDVKKKKCDKHNDELNNLKTEISNLKYPDTTSDNGQKLYDQFLYYLTCCYWQLEFLYKICGANSGVGGWEKCTYGKDGPESSDQCKDNKGQQNHEQRCSHCSNNSGCLQAFITDMTGSQSTQGKNIYTGATYNGNCPDQNNKGPKPSGTPSCPIPPMGFDKNKLPPGNEKSGYHSLHSNLNSYFSGHNKSFPKLLGYLKLLELLQGLPRQGSSSITAPKSWVAGDFWAFWYQLNGNKDLKNKLKTEIQKDYKNGFRKNGSKNKDYTDIDKVFSNLLFPRHSTSSQHSSLLSLSDCDGSKSNSDKNNSSNTCGKYLYGLFSDPFHHVLAWFKDSNTIELLTFEVLQTFASGLKEKLETLKNGLQGKAKTKQCVLDSSCRCIVWCDDTHTVLYRHGFTFYSPTSLAVKTNSGGQLREDTNRSKAQKRKCSDLKDQLEKVLDSGSALDVFSKLEKYVPPRAPLTIYEMLLWLHGLTQNGQKQKLETHITTLNGSLTSAFSTASSSITNVTTEVQKLIGDVCNDAGQIIVSIQKGQNNNNTSSLNQELQKQPFIYESDGKQLYDQFVYYLTACYWQLKFLYTVCGANSGVGGWAGCRYGKNAEEDSDKCKKDGQPNHKERCKECSTSYKGCLQAFLTATNGGQGTTSGNNLYKEAEYKGECPQVTQGSGTPSCPVPPMGFDKDKFEVSSKNGSDLNTSILKAYFNGKDKPFPKLLGHLKLLELLEASSTSTGSSLTLKAPGSWNVSDLWALFLQLNRNTNLKNTLNSKIKGEYPSGFIRKEKNNKQAQKADFQDLDKVFKELLFPGHSSSHPSTLLSLSDCDGGVGKSKDNKSNKCGKYLYSLFFDPFHHVLEWFKDNIKFLTFPTLQNFASGLKEKLTEFKQELEKKDCVRDSSQCQCIVWCDETHAFLYRNGFTFMSPKSLAVMKTNSDSNASQDNDRSDAQKRKCKDLKEQLDKVTAGNSPLDEFIGLVAFTPPEPTPQAASLKAADVGSTSSSSAGAAGTQQAPVSSPDKGNDANGQSSQSAVPPPPAAPPTDAASQVPTPAAPPASAGGPKGRSGGSVQVQASSSAPTAVVTVPGPNAQSSARSASSSSPHASGATTTSTTPTAGAPSSSTPGSTNSSGTVNIRDNHKDGVDIFKTLFGKVLDRLKTTFSAVSNIATNTSSLILKEINAHHSSLLEPPCNVKECIDWLIRVGEMDKKGWRENKKSPSSHKNGLFTRYCILCFTAGPLQKNSMALEKAIRKLTGSQRSFQFIIQNLISSLSHFIGYKDGEISSTTSYPSGIATASYHSAYSLTAQWPTCGPGAQCRGCKEKDDKCNCTASSSSCDGQCCNRCDVRICAGIFIAMVPALDKALRELREKCDQKLKGKNGQTINSMTEIFQPFGFKEKDLNGDKEWNKGRGPGTKLTRAIEELSEISKSIKSAFENTENRPDRNGFEAPENSTAGATTAPSVTTAPCSTTTACATASTRCSQPTSIREMLLWLMGLPYCEGYKQFVEKLKEKFKEHNKSTSSSRSDKNPEYFIHRQYSAVIFQLPVLFYAVEADVSYLRDTFCQFTGDDKNCKIGNDTHCTTETTKNCTTGTHEICTTETHTHCTVLRFNYERCGHCLLRTFCACVAVLYPVQRFLIKRCYSAVRAAERRTPRRPLKPTATDKDCCAPCPSGLDDWSQLCVRKSTCGTACRDCKQGTECNSGKCCKDNKSTAACNTSTVSVIRPSCQCRALYDFVCFMGFRVGATVAVRGMALHGVLKECFGEQDEEAMESGSGSRPAPSKNNTYVKLASCWRLSRCVLRSHCQKGESSPVGCDVCSKECDCTHCASCVQDNALSSSSCSPSTIRQMMLWLIGLPLTEAYKKDQDTVPTGQASGPSAVPSLSSSGYLFGPDGCVSNGVQCIPQLKKLEENNDKAQQKVPKKGSKKESLKPSDLFKRYYKETIVWMLVVFNAIEGNLTSVLCYLRDHAPGTGASRGASICTAGQQEASSPHVCSRFTYEFEDPSELLGAFCRYIYRVHCQLRFLMVMCSVGKGLGGWRHCIYGGHNQIKSNGTDIRCQCSGTEYTGVCHHPLQNFLTDGDKKKSSENKFKHGSNLVIMGFSSERLPSQRTEGSLIATVLEALIDTIHTSSFSPPPFTRPLSLLAQYCVAIGPLEPSSLGDLFTVFGDVAGGMWMTMYLYGTEGQRFSRMLLCELWSVFKCCNEGCTDECNKGHSCSDDCQKSNRDCARRYCLKLSGSISNVMTGHNSKAPNDSCNDSHHYSLSSLMCSGTTNTGVTSVSSPEASTSSSPVSPHCAPYLKSLSQGLYTYYCPTVPGAGDSKSFGVLQWLYDRLRQLLDGMKKLKEAFEKCHEKNKKEASCQSSCSDIVSCPYAHPTIYSFGFMLGEPKELKGRNKGENCKEGQGKKNCASFLEQLGCVLSITEGCQKGCCEKERGLLCCQRSCVPSQASPPSPCVPTSPVSALYSAFECVINIVYRIMLKRALYRVECVVKEWYKKCDDQQQNASQKDNENVLQCQLTGAFESYVTNAMYESYPTLICTFACQVFDSNYNRNVKDSVCDVSKVSHASQVQRCPCVHRAPGPRITTRTSHTRECHCSKLNDSVPCSTSKYSNAALSILPTSVTTITAIIPQYTAPVIDPYHYKAFKKDSVTESKEKASGISSCATSYDFQSAMDFHLRGANCILPVPANLRSAVDWMLRVSRGAPATKGDKQNNDCKDSNCNVSQQKDLYCDPEVQMFQCLAEEIFCVLNGDQKDAEKKQCDQKDSDTLSTRNVSSTVSQCQDYDAVFTCNTLSTVSASCPQCLLLNLAQGLRTFVGYKDVTQEVKREVCQKKDKVRGEMCSLLECLRKFMCNKGVISPECSSVPSSQCSLSAELGNALLKGRYRGATPLAGEILKTISAFIGVFTDHKEYDGAPFSDVLCIFSRALQSDHKHCHSDLKCCTLRDCKDTCVTSITNTCANNNCVPQGLSLLCDFFQGIQQFACEWNHIGKKGSASKESEAQECPQKEEQLPCCSKESAQPCSSSCSKLCAFAPSSDVVFNQRRKAECLPWKFNGHKKNCPQDCSCKEPKGECCSESNKECSSPSCPRGFFQQLQCGLEALGQCAQKVSELCQIENNGATAAATAGTAQCNTGEKNNDSQCHITQYRHNICALIEALKRFGEHIEGCKFGGAPQGPKERSSTCNTVSQDGVSKPEPSVQCSVSPCSCRADPSYAVDGAKKLMEETKRGVECFITNRFRDGAEAVYGIYSESGVMRISKLMDYLETSLQKRLCLYQSHLDDLRRLCQWLYRMSQLYASGLKGFVESLVSHLEHIIQVIDWITGIERMMRGFGTEDCAFTATELITVDALQCIPACCQRHKGSVTCEALCTQKTCDQKATCANGTVTVSSSSSTETNTCVTSPSWFFDALNCRIDNLLSSYVLGPLPTGTQKDLVCSQEASPTTPCATITSSSSDLSCHFRAFLERLRLLALDRYTLQVWQDECCPKDRVSSIRHWNVLEGGIVRHSDLEAIKRALGSLTLMEDYKGVQECGVPCSTTGQDYSSVQCSNASSTLSPSRIHDFHAICVLQKFSYEAPLRALQCSIKGLQTIKEALQSVEKGLQPLQELLKEKDCHSRGVNSCDDQCLKSCKDCCKDILSASSSAPCTATPFCELYRTLCEFLNEKYGVYNLAQFLHTILGPNIFSAAMFAIRDLRDILCQFVQCCDTLCSEPKGALQCTSAPVPSNKDSCSESNGALQCSRGVCCLCRLMRRMSSIVSTLNERNALRIPTNNVSCVPCNVKEDCYSLEGVTKRLQEFVDVLKREYIFAYPVVCGIELQEDCNEVCPGECDTECSSKSKDASLACSSQSSVTDRNASTSVSSPMPPLCTHCHVSSSICQCCIPILARMFITLVPVLYPQLCYLAYQCRLYWQQDHMNGYKDSALSSLMHTFGFERKDLYDYLYIDVPFTGTHIYKVLNKETNSLQLLCQDMSEPSQQSPFNESSPLCRLYTLCVSYYQRRKNERLTDSKRTTPLMPTTVRQILRFFVYLPFSSQFQSLQAVLRSYCSASGVVNFSDLFASLMMSSAMSAVLLQLIECPQGMFLRFFDDIYTNTEGYHLGTNTERLFFQLCDLSVTLYRGLKFLSLQCGTERSIAGWKDCCLRGVKRNNEGKDTEPKDTQQLQLCVSHLCECQSNRAKASSTTCIVTIPTASTPTTVCPFPLLRYLTDADRFFDSRRTVPSALRKVCLNDSCQEMLYRHMAPRGWQKELLQCEHRDEQKRDSQLEVCDLKACSSVCFVNDSDPLDSKCHPCCRTQCCVPVCSNVTGASLFHLLRNFVGHEHDADPLLQFTRYMVAIAAWPPDSLSGYMTFMLRFSDQLRKEKRDTQRSVSVSSVSHGNTSQENCVNTSVLFSLMSEITLFPGEFDPDCLIGAFLRVTHCEHNNGAAHTPVASSTTDTTIVSRSSQCPTSSGTTISVLRDCQQCQRLLRPLDYEVYDLYLPMYARRYLTWMLHFGPRLHRGMRALEKELKRHIGESSVAQSGVSTTDTGASGSTVSSQGSSHHSVLQCPFALPELHSAGLHFWDPNRMCNVSCECLVDALQFSLKDSSPLAEFLRQCDSFLWSVRKPFYWLTMALWILATVYLFFVHFWRLDLARLLSHVIRSRASHLVYPKVLLAAEQSYKQYYAPR